MPGALITALHLCFQSAATDPPPPPSKVSADAIVHQEQNKIISLKVLYVCAKLLARNSMGRMTNLGLSAWATEETSFMCSEGRKVRKRSWLGSCPLMTEEESPVEDVPVDKAQSRRRRSAGVRPCTQNPSPAFKIFGNASLKSHSCTIIDSTALPRGSVFSILPVVTAAFLRHKLRPEPVQAVRREIHVVARE